MFFLPLVVDLVLLKIFFFFFGGGVLVFMFFSDFFESLGYKIQFLFKTKSIYSIVELQQFIGIVGFPAQTDEGNT